MGERADWQASVGQILRLAQAYAGEATDDQPDRPSRALEGYLRCARRAGDYSLAAIAASQIRDLLEEDWTEPDIVEIVDHLFLPAPGDGRTHQEWLRVVADLLEARADGRWQPDDASPLTSFEWRTCYPDLAQVIGVSFHVDALQLHGSYEAALDEGLSGSRFELNRAIGQLEEILVSDLDETTLKRGMRALGAHLLPPRGIAHGEWLTNIGSALRRALDTA
jgi:hypothetical protein